jgi:hypothetical protein
LERKLLEVVETDGDIVTSINCDFREMFSILIHLVQQVSLSTGGEISYNEVLDDLKLIETKEETDEYKH